MNIVLEYIKRYLFEIVCGACAAVAIALGVLGMGAMSNVTSEMEGARRLQTDISNLARRPDPINKKAVDLAQDGIDQIKANHDRVMAFARESNRYEPLTPRAFPTASPPDRVEFRDAYQAEVNSWLDILKAGDVPTADYIAQERDLMEAEMPVDESLGTDRDDRRPVQPKKDAKLLEETAEVRAAIRNAKSIYCYATPASFQDSDVSQSNGPMYATRPPSLVQMWQAQLEVWVQRSIVNGIAAINNTEAERLRKEGMEPWVGNLPIKKVVSIQTTTYYVTDSTQGKTGGDKERAYPPGSAAAVFTGNKSNELFELMQFSVRLVVDARDIPRIVSDLCRGSFHSPLRIEYESVPPNLTMEGMIYGDEPVVTLTVDFETVFFSDLYLPLMPDKILQELGKKRPQPPESEGT